MKRSDSTQNDRRLDLALFSDRHMLPGLHVTLLTLLRSMSEEDERGIMIHLFLDRVGDREAELLRETHAKSSRGSTLVVRSYSPSAPPGGNPLLGNSTTYGRIRLADLLATSERCVYLDCDLLVQRSVRQMEDLFSDDKTLVVDGTGRRCNSLDRNLFSRAGVDPTGTYFNAGVMGINLSRWRSRSIGASCDEAARTYAGLFLSADQALLNLVLHDDFVAAGDEWNTQIFPSSPAVDPTSRIIFHFVGAPKPWDLGGQQVCRNFGFWHEQYRQTAIGDRSFVRYASARRGIRIAGQVFRTWKHRLSS